MGIRDSFSRLKEKLELKPTGGRRKLGDMGPSTGGKGDGPAGSLPRPIPNVAVGGRDVGGSGFNIGGRRVRLAGLLLRPPSPNNQEGERVDVDGAEVNQKHSHLCTDVEVAAGSLYSRWDGADEEEDQFYSCSSAPSTPRSGSPDGV